MRVFPHIDELIEHLWLLGVTASAENERFTELDHGLQWADGADDGAKVPDAVVPELGPWLPTIRRLAGVHR
jgi:hypothetical protein